MVTETKTKPTATGALPLTEAQHAALDRIRLAGAAGIGSWHFAVADLDALGARICRRDVNAASTERDQICTMAPELTATQARDLRLLAGSFPWTASLASTTVNRPRAHGYVAPHGEPVAITPAGRARLEVL